MFSHPMSSESITIRPARISDAATMLAIYAPFVEQTSISFEVQVPSLEEFSDRIHKYLSTHICLVAELLGQVVGYAYGSPHRGRCAYRWSTETSVYVSPEHHRLGVGRQLYVELLCQLASLGFCNAFARVALPNPASVEFHMELGFVPIGTFPRAGYKFGRWHDVRWFHKVLRQNPPVS